MESFHDLLLIKLLHKIEKFSYIFLRKLFYSIDVGTTIVYDA